MNKQERFDYYNSGKLQPVVQVCLLDWLNYWANADIDTEITDPLLLKQTKAELNLLLNDLSSQTTQVSMLVFGNNRISEAEEEAITETLINTVVVWSFRQRSAAVSRRSSTMGTGHSPLRTGYSSGIMTVIQKSPRNICRSWMPVIPWSGHIRRS